MNLLPSSRIYIARSIIKNAGRGVFANTPLKKGQSIEKCPVIDLSEYDTAAIRDGILISYLYYFGKKKERSVVALGYGSIYNHQLLPNAMYRESKEEHIIEFITIKDIKKDEEITVNYSGKDNDSPLWLD